MSSESEVGRPTEEVARPIKGISVSQAAARLASRLPSVPEAAVVVGSGLGALEESLLDPVSVPFHHLPGLPVAGVAGHGGRFVHGRLGASDVLVQSGRYHLYEGHPAETVVAPVRILSELGVRSIVMTNASGGIHAFLEPGDLVLVDDVLNLTFRSPLAGSVPVGEVRFPDMSRPLDAGLSELIRETAVQLGQPLASGTYVAVPGPQYETAAEVRMLSRLGADLVGMSTVPEVITAAARGRRCAVVSLVTNRATGLAHHPLSHEEVLEVGRRASGRLVTLLTEALHRLAEGRFPDQSGEAK